MANIELVIKLPEKYYRAIMKIPVTQSTADMLIIKNGILLPKGHGDLKDIAEIERLWQKGDCDSIASALIFAPPVIEADKEEDDEAS